MSYSDYIKYLEENNKSANMSNLNDYIKANNLSAEDKRGILQQQMLGRVADANGMTVNQLVSYGNNADLWKGAKNGESVVLSTPNTDAKKAAYYSQQAATPVSGYYDFLAKNALDTKGVTYAMAEKMRQESERINENNRMRAIVDSETKAAQNMATHGANAELMGRMGLTGSGYSDYIGGKAYAAGMAGRQAANAQATEANEKAMYTEMMAKLEADKEYNNALARIETAKYNEQKALEERNYAEQKQKEALQQTNYQNFMNFAIENGLTAEQISNLAPSYGISTEDANKVAETNKILYGDNTKEEESTTPNTTFEDVFYKTSGEGDNATVEVKTASEAKVSYDEAKKRYEEGKIPEDEWRTIDATYEMEHGNGNIVSIYSKTYDENSFGKFTGGEDQKDLISAIVLMAEGKIMTSNGQPLKEEDVVPVNFGSGVQQYWVYKGNGKFEKTSAYKMDVEGIRKVVVPEGFVAVEKGTNIRDWKIKKK